MLFKNIAASAGLTILMAAPVVAQDISAGSRVTIKADGREDYTPRIVACGSNSGMCLRDTRSEPADKPMNRTQHGLQVNFPAWGVIYLFQDAGRGTVFDMSGTRIGSYTWSQ